MIPIFFSASMVFLSSLPLTSNLPPMANAGDDAVVSSKEIIQLDGTSSREPDGIISRYHWVQTAGAPAVISNASAAITGLENLKKGTYRFRLTVMDDRGGVSSDEITLTVNQ